MENILNSNDIFYKEEKIGILHGDCISIMNKMPTNIVDLCVTSPPYVDLRDYIDIKSSEYVEWMDAVNKCIYDRLKENGAYALNIMDKCENGERLPLSFEIIINARKMGFKLIEYYIWIKKSHGMPVTNRPAATNNFEFIYLLAKGTKPKFFPDQIRTNYLESSITRWKHPVLTNKSKYARGNKIEYKIVYPNISGAFPVNTLCFKCEDAGIHPAAFPELLPSIFILSYSEKNDLVLDPFLGSGTTLKACKNLNRCGIGIEIHKEFCEISKRRIENTTGDLS